MRIYEENRVENHAPSGADHFQTLLEINNAIITTRTREELLSAIADALQRIVPYDQFGISLYDADLNALRYFAIEGLYESDHFVVGRILQLHDSISGLAFTRQQPVLRRDLESERQYSPEHAAYAEGIRSLCTVPLIAQGKSIGVMGAASRIKNQYTMETIEFLQEVATQVSLALANVKAYEEIQTLSANEALMSERRRALLELNNAIITHLTEESFFHSVCAAMKLAIAFDQAGITLYEPEHDALRVFALEGEMRDQVAVEQLLPLKDSQSGQVIDPTRTRLIRDLEIEHEHIIDQQLYATGMRSYCCVPVFLQGKVCGTIGVGSLTKNQYTEADVELMQEVASQISLAFANMRSYEAIRLLSEREAISAERRRNLLEINNAIVTKLTQQDLCEAVFAALPRVVPFDRVGLSLFDYEQDAYRIIALAGSAQSESFNVGRLVSRQENWVTEQFGIGQPWFRPDLEAVDRSPFEQELFGEGLRSFCAVPLLVHGNVIGALSVSSLTKGQYSSADVELLQEVANQVAIAIANMRAYEEVAALNASAAATAERRQTLLEINNAVVTHLTQDELLRAIVPAVRRVIPFDSIGITIYEPEQDGFRLVALEGENSSSQFQIGQLIPREASDTGRFIAAHQPFLIRDLEREQSSFEQALYASGFLSFCVVALVGEGKPIGTIGVASRQRDQYTEADAEFLQEVANQIALSLQNSQLYEAMKLEAGRRQHTEEMLRAITEGTAAATGVDFFMSLARHLATALQIRYALAAECLGQTKGRVRTLAFWQGERFGDNFEYDVADTPCKGVIEGRVCYYPLNVQNIFPNDADLQDLGAESYLGVTIFDTRGQAVGHLAVMDDRPMGDDPWRISVLKTFAGRAGAELERLRAEQALRVALTEVESLKNRLQAENLYLQEEIRTEHNFDDIIGNSPVLIKTLQKVELVARTDSTVLVLGETGTGKELIARAIHDRSMRKNRPLVKVNCGAISAGLVESELFGHVKGAFTGAVDRRTGRFELANGGTIFLDEVGELPLETQVKMLRVLQEGEFEPVGSSKTVKVDVRVIAATNRNLEEAIREGRFRSDLFYRLNVFPLQVPRLSERCTDIPQLAMFFLSRVARQFGKTFTSISQESIEVLMNYSWPGNIRELQNIIERAVVLSEGPILHLDPKLFPAASGTEVTWTQESVPRASREDQETVVHTTINPASLTLREAERQHIISVLERSAWVIDGSRGAAKALNLHPNTLRSRLKKLGIKRPTHENQ